MIPEPMCAKRRCRHYQGPTGCLPPHPEVHVCPAFPRGIPDRIAYGTDPHTTVARDQVGTVTYEEEEER